MGKKYHDPKKKDARSIPKLCWELSAVAVGNPVPNDEDLNIKITGEDKGEAIGTHLNSVRRKAYCTMGHLVPRVMASEPYRRSQD